jgi:phytanoyl-CoA hydroxylase
MSVALTSEEIQAFHDRGYLILRNVFEQDELDRLRREADRILELTVNSSLANDRTSGRLDLAEDDAGNQQVRKIQPVNDLSREIARVSQDDRFVKPMQTLLGDTPILMEEKLNYKQPLTDPVPALDARHDSTAFPVHNDWAYYREDGYPRSLVWSAICLDDCTEDAGPLHVWPGSHVRHIPHERRSSGLVVPESEINYNAGTSLCVPAGSIVMCHSLLIHNSRHNDSSHPRRLMIYSHYPESEFKTYFDERNGPIRYEESQWESEYYRKKRDGEYTDEFSV